MKCQAGCTLVQVNDNEECLMYWLCLQLCDFEKLKTDLISGLTNHSFSQDVARILNSNYNPFYWKISSLVFVESYSIFKCSIIKTRIFQSRICCIKLISHGLKQISNNIKIYRLSWRSNDRLASKGLTRKAKMYCGASDSRLMSFYDIL